MRFHSDLSRQCHSSYVLQAGRGTLGVASMNQADHAALLALPTDWPRIWSAIYGHREACIAEVLAELDAVLDTPGSTRREIRERVRARGKAVLETGPMKTAN